ncbi:MAG: hypothetical protein ACE14W_01235 [Candidatus Velamenicoccus archaeovorus]
MAERICWNCGSHDLDYKGEFTHRCEACGELERDVRCRKCLRPLFLSAQDTMFSCSFCGTRNRIAPGVLEGQGEKGESMADPEAQMAFATGDGTRIADIFEGWIRQARWGRRGDRKVHVGYHLRVVVGKEPPRYQAGKHSVVMGVFPDELESGAAQGCPLCVLLQEGQLEL